nr:uncharacterized protein LOC109184816 [Ipomoea trifida]
MVEERRTSMDSTGKEANFGRDTRPPGIFTLKLRHGGRISQSLPAKYLGGSVSDFNDMEEDEWGLICLREKVGELGYAMDESLRYFMLTEVGLKELVTDFEVWNLISQACSPKVLEIWIVKGGVGDDADEYPGSEERSDGSEERSDGSGSEWYGSGEESDDSDEEYNSEDLVNIDVHDDDLFVKNIDVNAEFSGLGNVQVQSQQDNVQVYKSHYDVV